MKRLIDELLIRFPEISKDIQETEELPYVALGYLVDWLELQGIHGYSETIIQRLVDFAKWCESQPRGETASDDIYTIFMVELVEGLLMNRCTIRLIPKIVCKTDLEANEQYLATWVGRENYNRALKQF